MNRTEIRPRLFAQDPILKVLIPFVVQLLGLGFKVGDKLLLVVVVLVLLQLRGRKGLLIVVGLTVAIVVVARRYAVAIARRDRRPVEQQRMMMAAVEIVGTTGGHVSEASESERSGRIVDDGQPRLVRRLLVGLGVHLVLL